MASLASLLCDDCLMGEVSGENGDALVLCDPCFDEMVKDMDAVAKGRDDHFTSEWRKYTWGTRAVVRKSAFVGQQPHTGWLWHA